MLLLLQPSCSRPSVASMSAAVRKAQYKSRGPSHSAKERLRTECLARVRENRLSIIAAVREKQSTQHSAHSPQFTPAADEQAAHDVAAASFNAIISSAMAAQRNEQQPFGTGRSPLSPSSTPDSPSALSQQSTASAASAPSLSSHTRLHTLHHTHTPLSSDSAPPTYLYSPSLHPPPFPHSLLQSMPAAGRAAEDEKDGGMEEDEVGGMSAADWMQLMNDMAQELWSEQQLIESEENLSHMPKDDGWLDPDGDSLSQEYEEYMQEHESSTQRIPCPICRSSYLSFAPSSSLSAFAAPLLNCSGCGLSLLCQRCCSTADVTSLLGDALERHSSRMCSQSPSFLVEHVQQSSLSSQGGVRQQLRLVCGGCGLSEVVQV